jgi:hypothetical protein
MFRTLPVLKKGWMTVLELMEIEVNKFAAFSELSEIIVM